MQFLELLIGIKSEYYSTFFNFKSKKILMLINIYFLRIYLMCWSQRRGAWDEGGVLNIRNLYTIKALSWKSDGSILTCSNMLGAVIAIDCSMRVFLKK